MLNRFFIYPLITAFILSSSIAIGMSDDESYEEEENQGELIERVTEEYIDVKEAKALGLELKEVKVEKQENHDKLEQTDLQPSQPSH